MTERAAEPLAKWEEWGEQLLVLAPAATFAAFGEES